MSWLDLFVNAAQAATNESVELSKIITLPSGREIELESFTPIDGATYDVTYRYMDSEQDGTPQRITAGKYDESTGLGCIAKSITKGVREDLMYQYAHLPDSAKEWLSHKDVMQNNYSYSSFADNACRL